MSTSQPLATVESYSVLYVPGWVREDNEPEGGRILEGRTSLRKALALRKALCDGNRLMRLFFGRGHVVIVRASDGTPLFAPTGIGARLAELSVEELAASLRPPSETEIEAAAAEWADRNPW